MIKSLFSRESKPSEPAPFIDLLIYRSTFQSVSKENPEGRLFEEIPCVDKGVLQKCKVDTNLLSKIKPPFKRNNLKEISDIASSSPPNEIGCCVILYNCLCWYYNSSDRQIDDFIMAIKALNLIHKCNSTISSIRNLIYIQFIKLATSPPPRFKITEEVYHYLEIHLIKNTSLDTSVFSLLIQLFRQIINTGKEEYIDKMYDTIINLLNVNQSFFDYNNISSFMPILNLSTLKKQTLNILAKLSTNSDSNPIKDAYNQLPITMNNVISKQQPTFEYIPIIDLNIKVEYIPPIIEGSEPDDFDFSSNFKPISYNILNDTYEILQLINENFQKTLFEIAECLSDSSKNAQKIFSTKSFNLINKMKGSKELYQSIGSFFYILQKIIDPDILKTMIPQISSSLIFSPEFTVFDKLPKAMNTLRNFFFSLIRTIYPSHVVLLLNSLSNSPLILTECFFRILNDINQFSKSLFTSKEMIQIITETGIKLQSIQSSAKVITSARTVYFSFVNELISSPQHSYNLLKSRCFCQNFLCYFQESKLVSYMTDTIENAISIVPSDSCLKNCSAYITDLIIKSSQTENKEEIPDIIEPLSNCIANGIRSNPSVVLDFTNLIELFLNYAEAHKNPIILDNMLILLILASISQSFELNISLYKKFSRCIKLIHNDEPSPKVEWQLFSALSGATTDFPLFLIKNPSIVPLILTSFSSSSKIIQILSKFTKLCNYSEVNKRACHDGDLVFILSQLYISNTVHYSDYQFEFKITEEEREKYAYPLIQDISLSYSNSIIDDFYIHNLENPSIFNLVMRMIAQCETILTPQFPIGIMPKQFSVRGIYPEDLKEGFSIHLCLNIDINSIDDPHKNVEIFRISDSNDCFLSIFVEDSMIMTKYEGNGSRTTVALVKMPTANAYADYTFIYKYYENRIRISSFQNLSPLNDSDFIYFEFASGELTLSLGGCNYNYKSISQYGIVKNFALFPTTSISNADAVKRLYSIEKQAIFSSNRIKHPSTANEFTIKRSINKSVKNCPSNITVSVYDSVRKSPNLLETVLTSNYSNIIAEKFFIEGILGTLKLLFQNSKHVQIEFESSKFIHLYLMKHPKLISSRIYFELYDLFTEITNKDLKVIWFEHLIINVWLWSQSSYTDLIEILTHWGKTLVYSHKSLFEEKSYFSQLLTQFRLFFCYEDDCVKPFNVTHFDNSVIGDEKDKAQKLGVLRDLFLNFLSKASYLHMKMTDVEEFFGHLMSNPTKPTIIYLMQLFYSFCNHNVDTTDYFPNLLSLICTDNEINEGILIAIHYMFEGQLNSFQPLIIAFEKMKSISKSNKSQEESANSPPLTIDLFDKLCTRLHSFPNLLPLLCLFALEIHKEAELGKVLDDEKETISSIIVENEFWYIWPVLLGFNTPESELQNACEFIVYALTCSETVLQDIPYTIIFINILMFATKETKFIQTLVDEFLAVRYTNEEIVKAAVEVCFYCCFFHFSGRSFHDFFLEECKNQGVDIKFTEKEHVGFLESVRDMEDLKKLATMSYTAINLNFELRIDLMKKWKDLSFAATAMRLLSTPTYKNETFILVFQYFTDPRLIQPESTLYSLQSQLETIIQGQFKNYSFLFISCFSSLIQRFFPNFFKFINKTTSLAKQVASKPKNEREELAVEKMREEIERSSNFNITIVRSNLIKPDSTCCLLFTPMKRRRKKIIKSFFNSSSIQLDDYYFEINCKRITASGNDRNTVLRCSPKYIVIGNKAFPSNQLSLVLSRKRNFRENSIELFMRSGDTFLLDFSPNENGNVFKSLLKANYPNAVIQKGSSYSFFSTMCNYTDSWEKGMMSNFDYLLLLNIFAGRSYNDLTLCPILPLIAEIEDITKVNNISDKNVKVGLTLFYLMRSQKDQDFPNKIKDLEITEDDKKYYEFIYQMRKLLEGKTASQQLPSFIDNYFGIHLQPGLTSFPLFKKRHNGKQFFKAPQKHIKIKEQRFKLNVLYAKFIKAENSVYFAIIINQSSKPHEIEYKLIKADASSVYNVEIVSNQEVECDWKRASFTGIFRKVFIVDNSNLTLTTFIERNKDETIFFPYRTKFVIACENDLIYCPDDTTICIKSFINKNTTTLWKSESRITKIAANSDFKVLAFVTIDNILAVHSMNNGCQVNRVNINDDVNYLIFTKKWSFLVTFTYKSIVVLNVDGEVVKVSDDFNDNVIVAETFSSVNGFDFIIYQNDRNQVFYFEAFYPDSRKLLIEATAEIRNIFYDKMNACMLFIYANGLVQLIPFSLPE